MRRTGRAGVVVRRGVVPPARRARTRAGGRRDELADRVERRGADRLALVLPDREAAAVGREADVEARASASVVAKETGAANDAPRSVERAIRSRLKDSPFCALRRQTAATVPAGPTARSCM